MNSSPLVLALTLVIRFRPTFWSPNPLMNAFHHRGSSWEASSWALARSLSRYLVTQLRAESLSRIQTTAANRVCFDPTLILNPYPLADEVASAASFLTAFSFSGIWAPSGGEAGLFPGDPSIIRNPHHVPLDTSLRSGP